MRTDKITFEIFSVCPEWVFALAGLPAPGACRLESLTVKETERRIDVVITPDDPAQPLTIAEIQFRRDPQIFDRIVLEMALTRMKHPERQVQGVVLFGSRAVETDRTSLWRKVVNVVHLDTAVEQWRQQQPDHPLPAVFAPIVIRNKEALAEIAPECYRTVRRKSIPPAIREVLGKVFILLITDRFQDKSHDEIAMILDIAEIQKTRCGRELIAQGEAKGEARGEARILAMIAKQRFADLAERTAAVIEKLPQRAVRKLTGLLLQMKDRKELETWLKKHAVKD